MHRLGASVLLAAISYLLAAPMLVERGESRLPSCCRRDGKHHCSMEAQPGLSEAGSLLKSTPKPCSQYPISFPAASTGAVGFAEEQVAIAPAPSSQLLNFAA